MLTDVDCRSQMRVEDLGRTRESSNTRTITFSEAYVSLAYDTFFPGMLETKRVLWGSSCSQGTLVARKTKKNAAEAGK